MKTLVQEDNKFYLTDSRADKTFLLRNFSSVKKMPNEYFYQKFKITNDNNNNMKNSNYTNNTNNSSINNVWVLYGRTGCPFCQESIRTLTNLIKKPKNKRDEFIFIDNENTRYTKKYVIKELKSEIGNHNTVPIIFCNNKFIGGNSELHNFLQKK